MLRRFHTSMYPLLYFPSSFCQSVDEHLIVRLPGVGGLDIAVAVTVVDSLLGDMGTVVVAELIRDDIHLGIFQLVISPDKELFDGVMDGHGRQHLASEVYALLLMDQQERGSTSPVCRFTVIGTRVVPSELRNTVLSQSIPDMTSDAPSAN